MIVSSDALKFTENMPVVLRGVANEIKDPKYEW